MKYNPTKIERKWQKIWAKLDLAKAKDFSKKPKKYLLVEFPYPSGDGLHVGHVRSYTALDVLARQNRMKGFNVLYPMGWDAFGLPTENYAIKTGIHPRQVTDKNIKVFKKQMNALGLSFDWSREIDTSDPKYYKWTQWIFLQLFKKGLAYQAEMPINWCPSCKTGLANEEVVGGKCERCSAQTEKRNIKQWVLRITKYADRLIDDLDKVDYVEKIKTQQINWIGRSSGTLAKFLLVIARSEATKQSRGDSSDGIASSRLIVGTRNDRCIEVFTTRIDTAFGITAMVLAPEHPMVEELTLGQHKEEVDKYIKAARKKSEFERTQLEKEKTGVFTGSYCLNPFNGEKIPIWIGDYVIATYGGGAVMVVPAHDKRDFAFAKKFGLEIREVVINDKPAFAKASAGKEAFVDFGTLINSGQFNGLSSEQAIEKMTQWLKQKDLGGPTIQYKLRDWIFSRQHYWGEPIPIIHCQKCGAVPVPEKDLPVELPYVEKYQPTDTGQSPLSKIKDWVEVKCPECKGKARRETDTMPNWAGSCWYFLRYIDPKNLKSLADFKKLKYWLPVDLYNGGMEHTTLHLLYSRFWHKFLYDIGAAPTAEPYQCRYSHGIILGEGFEKMSKSKGNVVNPDQVIKSHGADSLRLYEMFMGPYDQAIEWSTQGLEGAYRFLNRIWQLFNQKDKITSSIDKETLTKLHQLIKKITSDLKEMKFNTAVAAFMEFANFWSEDKKTLSKKDAGLFLTLLACFVPHIAEELWEGLGNKKSVFLQSWPKADEKIAQEETFDLIIQINGKVRDKIQVSKNISEQEAKDLALNQDKIKKWLADKQPKKVIYIAGRLINLVV